MMAASFFILSLILTDVAAVSVEEYASNMFKTLQKNMMRETQTTCDEDWHLFEDMCYRNGGSSSSWKEASERCKDLGGSLASIDSLEGSDFLRAFILMNTQDGLNDRGDTSLYKDKFWEPSGSNNEKKDCVSVRRETISEEPGYRFVMGCYEQNDVQKKFICQRKGTLSTKHPQLNFPNLDPFTLSNSDGYSKDDFIIFICCTLLVIVVLVILVCCLRNYVKRRKQQGKTSLPLRPNCRVSKLGSEIASAFKPLPLLQQSENSGPNFGYETPIEDDYDIYGETTAHGIKHELQGKTTLHPLSNCKISLQKPEFGIAFKQIHLLQQSKNSAPNSGYEIPIEDDYDIYGETAAHGINHELQLNMPLHSLSNCGISIQEPESNLAFKQLPLSQQRQNSKPNSGYEIPIEGDTDIYEIVQ